MGTFQIQVHAPQKQNLKLFSPFKEIDSLGLGHFKMLHLVLNYFSPMFEVSPLIRPSQDLLEVLAMVDDGVVLVSLLDKESLILIKDLTGKSYSN